VRICLIYDHVFPQTIGGAERWMRDLALWLGESGHDVTYLTMRHWHSHEPPTLPNVRVVGLVDAGRVYKNERRTLGPPLSFGYAVWRHLARHGNDYDVVHAASFPYFSVLGAALARRGHGYRLAIDWHEVWGRSYWRRYAGPITGTIGWLVQRRCIRLAHRAYCMSHMQAHRLLAEGYRGAPVVLPGIYAGPVRYSSADEVDPSLVVYAGRHVREKRVDALLRGFAKARERRPNLRLELYGDGPDSQRALKLIRELGLGEFVRAHGRRPEDEVASALARAACLATASEREGYGLVVVEAAARGTPSVVVEGPENAATELVSEGVNGAIAPSAEPADVAAAILRVIEAGTKLRVSTAAWFDRNATNLRVERSLELVASDYQVTSSDHTFKGASTASGGAT
jgi:glycosyltransferase involved in cell wall biosynthesis